MAKGMYTQCFCLLTDGQTTLADTSKALAAAGARILKEVSATSGWQFGCDSIVISGRDSQYPALIPQVRLRCVWSAPFVV
jgi:hypothetical protein